MDKTYYEYLKPHLDRYDREIIRELENARRSGMLGEQQKQWQEEQDRLYEQKVGFQSPSE